MLIAWNCINMNYSTKLLFILNFKKASEIKKINYF